MESNVNKLENFFKNIISNNYVSTILIVLAILYGSIAAPKLPTSTVKVIKNPLFLLIALVIIAFMASKNGTVAIVVAIAICITLIGINDGDKILKVLQTQNNIEFLDSNAVPPTTNVPSSMMMSTTDASSIMMPTTDASSMMMPTTDTSSMMMPTTLPNVIELPKDKVVEARVEGTPNTTEGPKVAVVDKEGKPVKDDTGKIVVASPTIAIDETGKVITDEKNKPILVPPKAAITETGEIAKDKEGKVIVAPAIVEKDNKGTIKQDLKGKIMVDSCMVSVDGGNSVKLLYRTRGRKASGGSGLYDDFNMMFGTDKKPQGNSLSQVCVGTDCLDGYEPECLAPIN
jgi:hypothetical protein